MNIAQKKISYHCGVTGLDGILIYDADDDLGLRPGIVMAPNMMGITTSNIGQAMRVAEQGYVVLIADLYGIQPKNADQASAAMSSLKHMPDERNRMKAALQALAADPLVDAFRLGAIGFCYGGHCVLELARSGAPLRVTVCIHGTLDTRSPASKGDIKGKIMVLNGAEDPYVTPEQVADFSNEMASSGTGFHLVNYAGAVHSFTYPHADVPGKMQYNETVSNHAFRTALNFFKEAFV